MLARRMLAWFALLPVLAACGADADPIPEEDEPAITSRKPGTPGDTAGDDGSPSAAASPGGSGTPAGNACIAQPSCGGAGSPSLGAKRAWTHTIQTPLIVASGPAFHRGRDQIYSVGEPQWVLGKFTYGYADVDLTGEDVDVYVERGCAGAWEKLGTTKTTTGDHATIEGIEDDGGRVYFQIPAGKELAPGRHRIRLVVAGDQTSTDLLVDVVPKGTPIVVSDVDGTLTSTETAEYPALLSGALPEAQPKAADMLAAFSAKGYRIVYLTARPEWLTGRTKEFLSKGGFPPGIVHTTTGLTGALGGAATTFKSSELAMLAAHGMKVEWAFGNQPSDADAYDAAKIQPLDRRVFLRQTDPHGGRRIEAYSEMLPVASALSATCK
ncbi:MAG: phosphatidylinositol transfer protein [Deltaproteobacteria bacterium]|nr:phosphatidylinositol transfer protein [Deltaproteobacteria bacterium]